MKHSADLKGSGFKILPKLVLCETISHLKIYYVHDGPGLKHSVGGSLRTIFEMFSREEVFSRKSNRDLRNPIVREDVVKVDRTPRDSGKRRH